MTAGYSGTPLEKKLGLKEGYGVLLHDAPEHYFDLFSDLPLNLNIISIDQANEKEVDFVHLFFNSLYDLQTNVGKYIATLKKDAFYGLAGPKDNPKSKQI
jgi:hypothetical protein